MDLTCQHKNQALLVEGPEVMIRAVGDRRLYERFSPEDFQVMIDLYKSSVSVREVAEQFALSQSSVKRVLRDHGARRERRNTT